MSMFRILLLCCCVASAGTASPAAADEPKMVEVKVLMVGLDGSVSLPDDITEPAEFMKSIQSQAGVQWIRRFQTMTVDQVPCTMQTGETLPLISGYTVGGPRGFGGRTDAGRPDGGGGPGAMANYSMTQTGSMVRITPRILEDGGILVEASLESSRVRERRPAGENEKELPVPDSLATLVSSSTVRISSGGTVLLRASQTSGDGKAPAGHALISLTARIVESK